MHMKMTLTHQEKNACVRPPSHHHLKSVFPKKNKGSLGALLRGLWNMRPSFMSDSFIGWQMLVFFYRSCQAHLRGLGLEVKFSRAADAHVLVGKVPLCFTEKDINERKRGRSIISFQTNSWGTPCEISHYFPNLFKILLTDLHCCAFVFSIHIRSIYVNRLR